jgi:hypothetical protein
MATTAEQLAEAKAAKHKLVTGTLARVFVDQNGERVEYTATNLDRLNLYIRELEGAITPTLARRPLGFTF